MDAEKDRIVYSADHGFGIKMDETGGRALFCGDTACRDMPADSLRPVDARLTGLLEKGFNRGYSYLALAKGKQYAKGGNVEKIWYDPDSCAVMGRVTDNGGLKYTQMITACDGEAAATCSCPSKMKCAHSYAVLTRLGMMLDELRYRADCIRSGLYDGDGTAVLPEELDETIRSIAESRWADVACAKGILETMEKNMSYALLDEFLTQLIAAAGKHGAGVAAALVPSLVYNDTAREYMRVMVKRDRFDFRITDAMSDDIRGVDGMVAAMGSIYGYSGRRYRKSLYYFFNSRYTLFLNEITGQCLAGKTLTAEEWDAAAYLNGRYEARGEDVERIESVLGRFRFGDRETDILMSLLPLENRKRIYLSDSYNGPVPGWMLEELPDERLEQYVGRIKTGAAGLEDMLKRIAAGYGDDRRMAALLCRLYDQTGDAARRRVILESTRMLPESLSLRSYMSAYAGARNLCFSTDGAAGAARYRDGLEKYFDPSVSVSADSAGETYRIICDLTAPDGKNALRFAEDENGMITVYAARFSAYDAQIYALKTRELVRFRYGEYIERELAGFREDQKKREIRRFYEGMSSDMTDFFDGLSARNVTLSRESRASLEFSFHSGYRMSLRVGTGRKKYVVKNVSAFLARFERGETASYGKNLELTHTLDNFEGADAEALKLLLSSRLAGSEAADPRTPTVPPLLMLQLLETLKGGTVLVDGVPCLVKMDEAEASVSVDEDMVLHFEIKGSPGAELWPAGGSFIVADKTGGTVRRLTVSPRKRSLYEFARKYDGADLTPVAGTFREKVYSGMFRDIEVADAVKDAFRLSEMHINAYFDLENGVVTREDRLFLGDTPIEPSAMTRQADRERYAQYLAYLSSIGFSGGILENENRILGFLRMDMSELRSMCDVFLSDTLKNKSLVTFTGSVIRVNYENDIMSAFVEHTDYSEEELEQILRAIRRRKKFVLLRNDRIVTLDNEQAEDFGSAVEDLELDRRHVYEEKKLTMVQGLKALAHESSCRVDDYVRMMVDELKNFKDADIPVPRVGAELRPYQVEGYKWLSIISKYGVGGILADDMGLGKTLEMITLIAASNEEMPSLVVCPKSLIFNWKNEFARYLPAMRAVEIYGTAKKRMELIAEIDPAEKAVYITAYDSLRSDAEFYKEIVFSHVILDEAQFIKNVDAQKSRNVKSLKALHRFALTGTPIENNVIDLWSIFDFIMPGYLEDVNAFRGIYGGQDADLERLSRRVGPFILRRTKNDVLKDLPDVFQRILTAEMTAEQKKYYDAQIMRARQMMDEGGKAFDLLPYITRLRQVCVDPATFDEAYTGGSGKMNELSEIIDGYLEDGDHKLLIFSQFVKGLNVVEEMLRGKDIPYYMLTGDTDPRDRVSMAEDFNTAPDVKVFLVSLKAGGTGLNLIGADTVILLDPWWNVAAEDQAIARAIRIGQKRNVEVIKLICEDTVEQKVIDLQNIKKDIIDRVISDDDSSVTGTTLEDLAFILN